MSFAILVLLGLLYWSSTIQESKLIGISQEMVEVKNELGNLKRQSNQSPIQKKRKNDESVSKDKAVSSSKASSKYENLLKEDLFVLETLPKLLGDDFVPHGTQKLAAIGRPDNLHPFSNWAEVNSWLSLCGGAIGGSAFGKYETLTPDMALKMEERINPKTNLPEYWVFLRDELFWQPLKQSFFSSNTEIAPHFKKKHPVTSKDFKFYFDALMNPSVQLPGALALRTAYNDIEELEIIDDLTFVVRWKGEEVIDADGKKENKIKYISKQWTAGLRPLACFVYQYFPDGKKIIENDEDPNTYKNNSVWADNFASHWAKNIIVGCGAWNFDGMNERQIKFIRNKDYFEPLAALSEAIEIDFKEAPDNVWQAFKGNQIDSYSLQPNQELEFQDFLLSGSYKNQEKQNESIHRLNYVQRSYSYIAWNMAKRYFQSKKVRQALTMAIDRQRIIEQTLNGMGIEITGTFYRFSPSYDTQIKPFPFSLDRAKALLEEEGWHDTDGDGVIDKVIDGVKVPFSFSLTYYVKNPTSKAICEYVSTTLKQVGIDCRLDGVDIADISSIFDNKNFDSLSMGWTLGIPPEDPRQLWYSTGAKEKGSSNAIGFANARIDAIIDALDYEYNPSKRIVLYHEFDKILYDEQPYTFLYTPKISLLYRDYLQNVFLPIDRQDLIPGANVAEPNSSIFWLRK